MMFCVGCSKQEKVEEKPEPKPQVETPLSKEEVEEKLKELLNEKVEGEVLEFDCSDYDHNGTYEAFALVDTSVYYITEDEVTTVGVSDRYYRNTKDSLLKTDVRDYFVIEGYCATSTVNYVFTVHDGTFQDLTPGEPVEYFGCMNENELVTACTSYDAFTDGTGHTCKIYYLYYDGNEGLKEYQGIYVSIDDLSKYKGYEQIEEAVRNDKGGILDSIIYRENGIINVNYHIDVGAYGENHYLTYRLENNEIGELRGKGIGYYLLSRSYFDGTAPKGLPE